MIPALMQGFMHAELQARQHVVLKSLGNLPGAYRLPKQP
jgi:hypothetical protein